MLRWLFGPSRNQSNEYLNPGRLEDVIALIQVLGLDEYTSRSENALKTVLCGTPHSLGNFGEWIELAKKHPEFFRVYNGRNGPSVTLIARYLTGANENGPILSHQYIHGLVEAAIRIHQGQLQRRQILNIAWTGAVIAFIPGVVNNGLAVLLRQLGYLP